MNFIKPEKTRIYTLLSNNSTLTKELTESNVLITRQDYYNNYGTYSSIAKDVDGLIHLANKDILLKIADILLNNSKKILEKSVQELTDEGFLRDVFLQELGDSYYLSDKTLAQIFYTYKYSYSECFFENNAKYFIPECDLEEFENNEIANSFLNAMLKEFDQLSEMLDKFSDFYSYDNIPFEFINYLTHMLGFDQNTFLMLSDQEYLFRELAKNILDIYRIKGTEYSYQLLFDFLGISVELNNYYFDRRFFYKLDELNEETGTNDKKKFLYYLTKRNPLDNYLDGILVDETITSKDIGKMEDIFSFNDYIDDLPDTLPIEKKLRILLGYDKYYKDNYDRTIKYEGPVFTYFKTNYINLNPKNKYSTSNLTIEQIKQINKIASFLTPIFMRRDTVIEISETKNIENLGLNWTRDKFFLLDSEDWEEDTFSQNRFISKNSNEPSKILTSNGYLIDYKNSLGYSTYKYKDEHGVENNAEIFKLPIGSKIVTRNTNKYLGDIFKPLDKNEKDSGKGYPLFVKNKNYTNVLKGNIYDAPLHPDEDKDNVQSVLYWPKDRNIIPNSRFENSISYDLNGYTGDSIKNLLRTKKIRKKIDWVTDKPIKEFLSDKEEGNSFFEIKFDTNNNTYWKKIKTFKENKLDTIVNNNIVINYDYINKELILQDYDINDITLENGIYTGNELADLLNKSKDCGNCLILKKQDEYSLYYSDTFDYEKDAFSSVFENNGSYTVNNEEKNIYETISSEKYKVAEDFEKKYPVLSYVNESYYYKKLEKGKELNKTDNHPYYWRPVPLSYNIDSDTLEYHKNNIFSHLNVEKYSDLYNSFSNYSNYYNNEKKQYESLNSVYASNGRYNSFFVDEDKKLYIMKKTIGNIKYISDRYVMLKDINSENENPDLGEYKYIENIYKTKDEENNTILNYKEKSECNDDLCYYRQNHLKRATYTRRRKGQLIYSTHDCKLYMLLDNGAVIDDNITGVKQIEFFGRIELDNGDYYINRYDKDFFNYEEKEYLDNGIFYNSNKEISWRELDVIKDDFSFTTRPTKEKTDKIIDDAMNSDDEKKDIVKRIMAYIYSQTASNFSNSEIPDSVRKEVWY